MMVHSFFQRVLRQTSIVVGALFLTVPAVQADPVYRADVVVIGSGVAGLSAAVAASDQGAKVMVLEKMPFIGGSSLLAVDYIVAVGEKARTVTGTQGNDIENLKNQIDKSGQSKRDPALIQTLLDRSPDVYRWLRSLGAALTQPVPPREGLGWGGVRTATSRGTTGSEITKALLRQLENRHVPIETMTQATKILTKRGRVRGVRAKAYDGTQYDVLAKSVVIATGSFASNPDMILKFAPDLAKKEHVSLLSTNAPGATGDGLILANRVGAALRDLDLIEFHPTTLPLTGEVISSSVRTYGGILVNQHGKRFVNELATRHEVGQAIDRQPGHMAWLILDNRVLAQNPSLESYSRISSAVKARDWKQLAVQMGMSHEDLAKTLKDYRHGRRIGKDAFGRDRMASDLDGDFLYAFPVRQAIHATSGGLVITPNGEVKHENGSIIPGLYAAGDVVSGINGEERVSGMGLLSASVFGYLAGYSSAQYANPHETQPQEPSIPLAK